MAYLNENTVLEFYLKEMENDTIHFLKDRDHYKNKISKYIMELKNSKTIHDKIESSKHLWKILFEASMTYLDADKRGYDKLFSFFDEYVKFEELIFASDSFYRDHTIHCLWVYFLGEYIVRNDEFRDLFKDKDDEFNYLNDLKDMYEDFNDHIGSKIIGQLIEAREYKDTIRCVSALTHDLGYPVKKVAKINKAISKVLPYYSIYNLDEFNFDFKDIQGNFIDHFLKMLSTSIDINIGNISYTEDRKNHDRYSEIVNNLIKDDELKESGKDVMKVFRKKLNTLNEEDLEFFKLNTNAKIKILQCNSTYTRYSDDFENYEHGIMSAFLLVKLLDSFKNTKFHISSYDNVSHSDVDIPIHESKWEILRAIADHTSSSYQITDIIESSAILTLMDELEEFSRISRADQNRQYINEFCKTKISYINDQIEVDFIFDNENIDNLDPEISFRGKCKRFLNLFDIKNLDKKFKIRLRCIGELTDNKNIYALEIRRGYANIIINGEEQHIPTYLNSCDFYSKEEYINMSK